MLRKFKVGEIYSAQDSFGNELKIEILARTKHHVAYRGIKTLSVKVAQIYYRPMFDEVNCVFTGERECIKVRNWGAQIEL